MKVSIVLAGILTLCIVAVQAQNSPGSPYTYFGIGDIYHKGSGHHLMKGGTGIADRSQFAINNLNPASYSSISNRFTYLHEFGVSVATATRTDGDDEGRQITLDFPYLMMAFKTGDQSGGTVGLRKYSNVDYTILGTGQFSGTSGEYRVRYDGTGGLNEVYFGYGQNLGERLSVGMHAAYIFGNIKNDQRINSSDINYSIGITDEHYLRAFNLDIGAQYTLPLGQSRVTVGATYDPQNKLSSYRDLLIAETEPLGSTPLDTLALEEVETEEYLLPHTLGFGVSWNRNERFALSADVQTQLWSASALEGEDYHLRDSRRGSIGFEKLPNYRAKRYTGYVRWSLGLYYEQSYLVLDDEGLNNSGVTVGMGFPLGNKAMLRLIAERSARGQQLDDFFNENYTKVTINLTFMDLWFSRRKLD